MILQILTCVEGDRSNCQPDANSLSEAKFEKAHATDLLSSTAADVTGLRSCLCSP